MGYNLVKPARFILSAVITYMYLLKGVAVCTYIHAYVCVMGHDITSILYLKDCLINCTLWLTFRYSFKRSYLIWMTRNSCSTRSNRFATPRAPSSGMEAPAATACGTTRLSSSTLSRRRTLSRASPSSTDARWVGIRGKQSLPLGGEAPIVQLR